MSEITTFDVNTTDPDAKCVNCGHSARFHHYTTGEGTIFDCWYMQRTKKDPENNHSHELDICTCRNYNPDDYEY